MMLFQIKTFAFNYVKEKKIMFGNLKWVSFLFKMLCFATTAVDFAVMPNPTSRVYGAGQVMGFSFFASTDFLSLHFPKTSLENGERKYIKDSCSGCEPGSQKRPTKEYLRTHCKAFFFTLNTSHLMPLTMCGW